MIALLYIYIILPFVAVFLIPFFNSKIKNIILLTSVGIGVVASSYFSVESLVGNNFNYTFYGSVITGPINISVDYLSAWFIIIFNIIFAAGTVYGLYYLEPYQNKSTSISMHYIVLILTYFSLVSICVIQNFIAFIVAWEIMALSSFFAVIFEHEKESTIKAGLNYLVQAHISIVFITLGFIYIAYRTGSYDFSVITEFTQNNQGPTIIVLFLFFFVGFALKAGFIPFHTWLPYAHPAAPSHVSGIMSGVLIKIGIYGILRMILLIKTDYVIIGYIILGISVFSGLYGVMLAIIQHNLKKLLAYHSIENIGIIGIGIGMGCVGIGKSEPILIIMGFTGALLHVFNHALFKSLLFFTSGIIYQVLHYLNIEQMGGLFKKMPKTAILFLVASIAISGIPPLNGFVSEFIIYSGLFNWIKDAGIVSSIFVILTIISLVLIGGLALLCFTKAFSIVFLGNLRHHVHSEIKDGPFLQMLPLYFIAIIIVFIGVYPQFILSVLYKPVSLFANNNNYLQFVNNNAFDFISNISLLSVIFILLVVTIFIIKHFVVKNKVIETESTWGCGYVNPTAKQQYTASSFIRSYAKLFAPLLMFTKKEKPITNIIPEETNYETSPYDKIEHFFIDKPILLLNKIVNKFQFLSNGKLQFYILYGVIFILSVIFIPIIFEKIQYFIDYLKQL